MTALRQRDAVVIGRVRIRASSADPVAAQQRFSHLLQTASFLPHSLPSSSLLCVRHLRDPAPRTQSLESSHVYLLPAWEEAVARSLDREAAGAIRPALASVPPDANAVLFLDDAELLSALASDWLSGALPLRWWWRRVLRTFDPAAVFQEWMRSPEAVPAALEQLRARRHDEQFVRSLPGIVAVSLLRQMLYVHGISADQNDREEPAAIAPSSDLGIEPGSQRDPKNPIPPAPWSPWIPDLENPAPFTVQDQLLIQALMLHRTRRVARSATFQQALASWISATRTMRSGEPCEVTGGQSPDNASRKASDEAASHDPSVGCGLESPAGSIAPELPSQGVPQGSTASCSSDLEPSAQSAVDPGGPRSGASSASERNDTRSGRHKPHLQSMDRPATGELDPNAVAAAASGRKDAFAPRPHSISQTLLRTQTSFGGVFFLLNAAIALGYYADFTAPLDSSLDLDIWDFLAIFGDLFTHGELRDDPLWHALAELARRDRADEAARPAELWIEATAGHLRGYLDDSLQMDAAAPFLCRNPSSFTCTPTHVDVFFSMQTHPIEIRKACLDRDPGWIPAAGRYVAFHFD